MKFDLRATYDTTAINHEFVAENISDLLEHLETFIKASGFNYEGYLNIFENDDPTKPLVQPTAKKDETTNGL